VGRIPGVLYGVDDDKNELKTLILVDQKSLARELREKGSTFENTVYELNVESETYSMKVLATPRQTQFDPSKYYMKYCCQITHFAFF
jgi:ribosomal protein L25 (general stress protein Ctc)